MIIKAIDCVTRISDHGRKRLNDLTSKSARGCECEFEWSSLYVSPAMNRRLVRGKPCLGQMMKSSDYQYMRAGWEFFLVGFSHRGSECLSHGSEIQFYLFHLTRALQKRSYLSDTLRYSKYLFPQSWPKKWCLTLSIASNSLAFSLLPLFIVARCVFYATGGKKNGSNSAQFWYQILMNLF